MYRNDKGISLYEVLATLAIASFLLGTIMFLFNYSQRGLQHTASRETVLRESRTILNNMVTAIRNQTTTVSKSDQYVLQLEFQKTNASGVLEKTGDYNYYEFTPPASTEPGRIELITKRGSQTSTVVLSTHVSAAEVVQEGKKFNITLTMQLPNHERYVAATVVYLPRLKIT